MHWNLRQESTGNPITDLHQTAFHQVQDWYDRQNPGLTETYRDRAERVAPAFSQAHRNALADALKTYMTVLGAGAASMQLVEKLRLPDSVVVVTGQQAGLFTGPLYTVYKAMSVIGLAKRLEAQLGRPVVPVFWVAAEDHDWDEVNHAYLLDGEDNVRRVKLGWTPEPHQMVNDVRLSETAVREAVQAASEWLPDGPYKSDVLQSILSSSQSGLSMADWFAKILLHMLERQGLVVVNPCLPALRNLVKPVWVTALQFHEDVDASLASAYAEVESRGFRPEVVRDPSNTTVFYVENGKRYVIERVSDNRLRVRGLGLTKSVDEWVRLAEHQPTAFSSNVLLRPVVQDTLLPTAAYVGGPSELAYHALSRAVFHAHGRMMPPLVLRDRLMLYTPGVIRNMDRWRLERPVSATPSAITSDVLQTLGGDEVEAAFRVMMQSTEERWQAFSRDFEHLGSQVAGMVQAQIQREVAGLQRLQGKTMRLLEIRHDAVVRQLRHVEHWLWTDGHGQERRLCPLNVWTKYGFSWLSELPFWGNYEDPCGVWHVEL